MDTLVSGDGTTIAFERTGEGPPLILVDGALCHRAFGPARPLAKRLAPHFTVYTYDRRGRGESGDTPPYQVEREVEDIAALVKEAGGSAYLYGISSGAALALEAADQGVPVTKLALYEAPFMVDASKRVPDDFVPGIERAIAAGRPGDAVRGFMKLVGTPALAVAIMRLTPVWPKLKRVGHTLPYDFAVLGDNVRGRPLPADRWAAVTMPTLVADGGKSEAWMRHAMQALAEVLPDARYLTLAGQNHMVKPDVLGTVLIDFFTA